MRVPVFAGIFVIRRLAIPFIVQTINEEIVVHGLKRAKLLFKYFLLVYREQNRQIKVQINTLDPLAPEKGGIRYVRSNG